MILGTGNLTKSFTGAFFLQYGRDILEKVFIIENTVRKGKSWCLAVICRKRSAFDLQFHTSYSSFSHVWKIVEIALLDCYNRKKDLISMYPGTLVSGFPNISVYFNKLANNFKPLDRFLKRIKILLVILLHEKFLQFDWNRAVVRITILKYHSWYLYQISVQIMLLPILIQPENSVVSHLFIFIPIAKCYLPYTVLRVEMILESYAKVYFNQFTDGNSPFQLV